MNDQTREMIRDWMESANGDIERVARWMRDVLRIGGMKENRELIKQATGGK